MAKREVPEGMKRCAGAPGLGYPAHDAPLADFGPNRSSKDGLYHQCREHAKVYQAYWRQKHAAEVKAKDEAAGIVKQTKRRVTKAMIDAPPSDEPEAAPAGPESPSATEARKAFEAELDAAGGPGTEAGQALLASKAAEVKAARKRSRKVTNVPDSQETATDAA